MIVLSPWIVLAGAFPVLLLGEQLHRRFRIFSRYNIPVSVLGGLAVAISLYILPRLGGPAIGFRLNVSAGWWTWLVTPESEWVTRPERTVTLPLLVAFFTCIGLNATTRVLRAGSRTLLVLLFVATLLAVVQNLVGLGVAKCLGAPPLLGLVCGALTLTGGHATALGFAPLFVAAGFPAAATVGAAAATFGLVAGGICAAPMATWLVQKFSLAPPVAAPAPTRGGALYTSPSFAMQLRGIFSVGRVALYHLLGILACLKAGSWLGLVAQKTHLVFPVYMGALLVGLVARNILDAWRPGLVRSDVIDRLAAIFLSWFLGATLATLNLGDLAGVAGPMLIILLVQIVAMLAFARWITWPATGRDYEAAVITAGHIGFGLGNTATAIASMEALTTRFGPAPRAYTVVPPTGGFLIDLTNAVVITTFLNLFRG